GRWTRWAGPAWTATALAIRATSGTRPRANALRVLVMAPVNALPAAKDLAPVLDCHHAPVNMWVPGGGASPCVTGAPQAPWHFLYFAPDPKGHGSLRPTLAPWRTTGPLRSPG